MIRALEPPDIIESDIPTRALLVQIAVSRCAIGLPLYRQKAIYPWDQFKLACWKMAQWIGSVGFQPEPLGNYVLQRLAPGELIFPGETTLPILPTGAGKPRKAWLRA